VTLLEICGSTDKTHSCTPNYFHTPSTEEEILQVCVHSTEYFGWYSLVLTMFSDSYLASIAAQIIRTAAAAGERVKAVGSFHSSMDINFTKDHMVSLGNYHEVIALGDDTVTVQAGIKIKRLIRYLDAHGKALVNLGAISEQV
jgi:hypothetical protein